MAMHRVSATRVIPAPAARVYDLLADYREGHPSILPKPYFVSHTVEQGGRGAGTIVSFEMKLMGRTQRFRSAITAPEPGRVLVETVLSTGAVTTFTVEPCQDGASAQVMISTDSKVRDGIAGKIEGWMTAQLLRPIYVKELEQLAAVVAR
jgi:ribosome-associated toxin RatA of RatAB toxin-antitoxin module